MANIKEQPTADEIAAKRERGVKVGRYLSTSAGTVVSRRIALKLLDFHVGQAARNELERLQAPNDTEAP